MYLSTLGLRREISQAKSKRAGAAAVGGNVFALGMVSLLTDVSAEMVTAVLPLYFVITLQMTPAAYGVMDGLYTGASAVLRMVGGYVADRAGRHKAVAGAGYGISAAAKLGMLAAGSSAGAIGAVLVADRTGKGLRSAPRDALITLSTPEHALGRAFGVHRAMDSAGAFAGPLVALAVLGVIGAATPEAFDALFMVSFCVAVTGVMVLALFVRDHPGSASTKEAVSVRRSVGLLKEGAVRRVLTAACLLGLVTVGDGFVYLLLMRNQGFGTAWFPMCAIATNLAFLLLAGPLGVVADRWGRTPVFLGGYAALALVYLLLLSNWAGTAAAVLTLALYGMFYAATDGVLMALAGPVLPQPLRATGLALVQTGQALAYVVSSVGFGVAWQYGTTATALWLATGAVVLSAGATAVLLLRTAPRTEESAR
ncbi:MFS transporter [Streptomyces sp. NPDC003023]|uniref:MFS transporter n=1 Tax=Streptomyces sp. NPDC003023 TaxID=3364675 RepID=UPI0036973051